MLAGREFDDALTSMRSVIVNESFARQWWPAGGGLGETLRVGAGGEAHVVTGIVADVRQRSVAVQAGDGTPQDRPSIFVPLDAEHLNGDLTIVARTSGAAASLVRPMIDAAGAVDPNIPVLYIQTMAQRLELPLWPFKTLRGLFSICGVLALVLATVGLASIASHAVSRRIREFGVRLSIGATPQNLVIDVLRGSAAILCLASRLAWSSLWPWRGSPRWLFRDSTCGTSPPTWRSLPCSRPSCCSPASARRCAPPASIR